MIKRSFALLVFDDSVCQILLLVAGVLLQLREIFSSLL
jgi:hypothetical protein